MPKYLLPLVALVLVLVAIPRLYAVQPWAAWGVLFLTVTMTIRWFVVAPAVHQLQLSGDTLGQVRRRALWTTAGLLIAGPFLVMTATGSGLHPVLFLPSLVGLVVLTLGMKVSRSRV